MFKNIATSLLRHTRQSCRTYCTDGGTAMRAERSYNKVTLLGRVGGEPITRGTTERPVRIFSLATSISVKQQDGTYRQYTEWHKIITFSPTLGELIENNVKKGDRLMINGSLTYSKMSIGDDKVVNIASVRADDIIFLTARQSDTQYTKDYEEAKLEN